ncbi:hypothetical protein ACAL88_003046 [Escherichia coli]
MFSHCVHRTWTLAYASGSSFQTKGGNNAECRFLSIPLRQCVACRRGRGASSVCGVALVWWALVA